MLRPDATRNSVRRLEQFANMRKCWISRVRLAARHRTVVPQAPGHPWAEHVPPIGEIDHRDVPERNAEVLQQHGKAVCATAPNPVISTRCLNSSRLMAPTHPRRTREARRAPDLPRRVRPRQPAAVGDLARVPGGYVAEWPLERRASVSPAPRRWCRAGPRRRGRTRAPSRSHIGSISSRPPVSRRARGGGGSRRRRHRPPWRVTPYRCASTSAV